MPSFNHTEPPSIPATYDNSSLSIDPASMDNAAQNIQDLVETIGMGIQAIGQTLSDLTLSWAGQSASQAQQYNDEWTDAVNKLLGTQKDPDSGALNTLVDGVKYAAQNYSETEDNVTSMFSKFAAGGSSSGPSVMDKPSDFVGDSALYHTTSVDENYPISTTTEEL